MWTCSVIHAEDKTIGQLNARKLSWWWIQKGGRIKRWSVMWPTKVDPPGCHIMTIQPHKIYMVLRGKSLVANTKEREVEHDTNKLINLGIFHSHLCP